MTQKSSLPVLMLGALGVVYGDIGTSPLYAVKEAFIGHHAPDAAMENVLGILSMMFWLLLLIVTVKYVIFVLRADNKGEGGDFALLALNLQLTAHKPWLHYGIGLLGILGGCLFYADAIITPAISVLSAVEGVKVYYDGLSHYILPITLTILIFLFCIQRFGTGRVGYLFGPITFLWFLSIGVLGAISIVQSPAILAALSPHYAFVYIMHNPVAAFFSCGAIVLVVTGAEALYADMGHFGRLPIRFTWIFVAICLVLNYFGQGALLLRVPEVVTTNDFNPFYMLVPENLLLPMVILATAATTIASQATISGAYSLTRQAMQLGYIPRLRIFHTSHAEKGQIYIPFVNWMMLTAVILVTVLFRSSSGLAAAYGIAVTGAMVVTTFAIMIVMVRKWNWPLWAVLMTAVCFLSIEIPLLVANMMKIQSGGWMPLLIAAILFTLLTTWHRGQRILAQTLQDISIAVRNFAEDMVKVNYRRVPGIAIFMTPRKHVVPHPLLLNLKYNGVLHETVALLTIQVINDPIADQDTRFDVQELATNFYRIVVRYGFMEEPDLIQDLQSCMLGDHPLFGDDTTFFMGRETIIPTAGTGMAIWREHIYAWMKRNAGSAIDFYHVPPARTIEIGGQYEI